MNGAELRELITTEPLLADGGIGAALVERGVVDPEGCLEALNLERPEVIRATHAEFVRAGARMIETNTFGANRFALGLHGLEARVGEINRTGVEMAREAATGGVLVAGSVGPLRVRLAPYGRVPKGQARQAYAEQIATLASSEVDLVCIETQSDLVEMEEARAGAREACDVAIVVCATFTRDDRTLLGSTPEQVAARLVELGVDGVGVNCSEGPAQVLRIVHAMRPHAGEVPLVAMPNAGGPARVGERIMYPATPEYLGEYAKAFVAAGARIVGGCCGTTPDHIRAISDVMKDYKPRGNSNVSDHHSVSGIESFIYDDPSLRPIMVGERTNVIGSRKFKRLIAEKKFEEAAEVARAQVKGGAHVIDICLADPDRDELEDMRAFVQEVVKKVKVPLVIDSTDEEVIEAALKYSQGKAIINSINLEDGEERFEKVTPLIHQYGAAVIVGTIDEQGMAVTAERKLEIAKRSHDLLVNKYRINPKDIIFDPLVFPE
jgi:5-methyltetrahydrofolate--homocysteine methyltransferase